MADTDAPNDQRDKDKNSDDDSKGLEEISSDEDESNYADAAAAAAAASAAATDAAPSVGASGDTAASDETDNTATAAPPTDSGGSPAAEPVTTSPTPPDVEPPAEDDASEDVNAVADDAQPSDAPSPIVDDEEEAEDKKASSPNVDAAESVDAVDAKDDAAQERDHEDEEPMEVDQSSPPSPGKRDEPASSAKDSELGSKNDDDDSPMDVTLEGEDDKAEAITAEDEDGDLVDEEKLLASPAVSDAASGDDEAARKKSSPDLVKASEDEVDGGAAAVSSPSGSPKADAASSEEVSRADDLDDDDATALDKSDDVTSQPRDIIKKKKESDSNAKPDEESADSKADSVTDEDKPETDKPVESPPRSPAKTTASAKTIDDVRKKPADAVRPDSAARLDSDVEGDNDDDDDGAAPPTPEVIECEVSATAIDDEDEDEDDAMEDGLGAVVLKVVNELADRVGAEKDGVGKAPAKQKKVASTKRREASGEGKSDALEVVVTETSDGGGGGEESGDMRFAIMDVRTVTEDDDDCVADDGKPKGSDDSEMKNYATDTMNELLGLFGYEKVDDTTKDAIQLGEKKAVVKKPVMGSTTTAPVAAVKSAPGRTCSVCSKTRSCKYQVLMLGTTKFLCDDNCFREFRTKQNITTAPAIKDIIAENRPITRSLTHPKDHCNLCHKEIRNGLGLLPGVGENKPLCSEECMRQYQAAQGLKRGCAQCGCQILSRSKCLTWEAMEFCNEECLGKYQSYLGSHCAYCNHAVQQTSLGKYCVRFGSDIKQFCSNGCLEEFKKGLKVCSYCQKDISTGTDGFLAPVGDKGQFKEFCSQSCMEKYETMGNVTPIQPSIEPCSVCNKVAPVKVEVTFDSKIHRLCSEPCIAAFRYANKINTSICDTCHKFFDLDVSRQLTIQFEGTSKRFCAKACMNVFVLYHRKVVPCSWCKVKKYNFDMIERVDSNNHVQLFCSLNCLSLFRVSLNATSSRKIQCDFCHHSKPAQYHLTMSDASIRNFCSYNCVMQFQGQFTTLAPVVNAPTQPGTAPPSANTQSSGTPVISSVMSLAPQQSLQQNSMNAPPPKSIVIRPPPPVPAPRITPVRAMSTQTTVPAVTQQIIVRNPPAKTQKNKTLMCKPMTQTKGVSCKPHPCHKTTQTDDSYHKPFMIPVPVPIFIPVPMRMYTTPVPYPLPFPLPIPVPIFIPTTKNSANGILRQIKEIQHKIPDNPFEADLILMAEMVADEADSSSKSGAGKSGSGAKLKAIEGSPSSNMGSPDPDEEGGFTVGGHMPDGAGAFGDDVLQMALRMASSMDEPVDLETALAAAAAAAESQPSSHHHQHHSHHHQLSAEENGAAAAAYMSPRELRVQQSRSGGGGNHKRSSSSSSGGSRGGGGRGGGGSGGSGGGGSGSGRGRKRARTERERESPPPSPQAPIMPPQFDMMAVGPPRLESNCVLKFSYGVNAWKHWVLQKNNQLEKASQSNRKLKLFKTDLLQLVADELNYSLCLFVKEVRKPNGEEYAPDSIYYLCLGIQQYLFENGRIDNIFADAYYEKFTECLNEVLQRYDITISTDGCFISRIEEEILWECKQLGAHSPHVLLNTLMYFNTKYFMLKTIDDHLQLSFTHILKHWKKTGGVTTGKAAAAAAAASGGRNVLLRYYPSSMAKDTSRKRKESSLCYEQVENLDNPLRCPVKLYEFYLSKCSPESIKNRSDVFYLYPERSCVPDSPVWYSTMSLGKDTIAKMLQRIRMIM